MSAFKLLIDGALVEGASEMDVLNPADGTVVAQCPRSDERLLNAAVRGAKEAFGAWSRLPAPERSSRVMALAGALETRRAEFVRLMTREQGKPLFLADVEIAQSVAILRTFAGMTLDVETLREDDKMRVVQQRAPLGVVAAITPWNFPLLLLMAKLGPALVAGNCVIAKPAPTTPLTTLLFGELCAELLPPGVVNTVVDNNDLGNLLTRHADIAKVAFTGSTPTGRRVMESAAPSLKRLTLELGGNDAAIVLEDAPVKAVATQLFRNAMINSGQVCVAIKRAYVHEALYDELCDELVSLAGAAVVGDGLTPGVQLGPLQNKAQFDRVKELIEDCRTAGSIVAGGAALDRPGYFIEPTIVRDIADDARIVREEQFGPVLPVLCFRDVEDAIKRANNCEFGLGASVWGTDLNRAYDVALRLDAGTVWINKHLDLQFDVPFRGAKQSGIGAEFGLDGLKEYTQAKVINMTRENNHDHSGADGASERRHSKQDIRGRGAGTEGTVHA